MMLGPNISGESFYMNLLDQSSNIHSLKLPETRNYLKEHVP